MLKLCLMTGLPAYVEPSKISAVVMAYWGGSLVYVAGGTIEVRESPDTVIKLLEDCGSVYGRAAKTEECPFDSTRQMDIALVAAEFLEEFRKKKEGE